MKINFALGLLSIIVMTTHAPLAGIRMWDAIACGICLVVALKFRQRGVVHIALLMTLVAVVVSTPVLIQSIGRLPVLPLLIPLLISSALVAANPATRPTLEWMRLGQVSPMMWLLVGVVGIGSAIALIVWAVWTDNLGVGEQMMASVAYLPPFVLILIVIPVFALFNALTEEAIYRGALQTALLRSSRSAWFANVLQAAAFAALHFQVGFPNGVLGYAMTLIYGLLLGYLRARTNGLLAPVVAHIVADLVIGYILLFGSPNI
jgi:membrane protease YdiL (CAAX protease family)